MGLSRSDLFHGDIFLPSPWLLFNRDSLSEFPMVNYFFNPTYRLIEMKDLVLYPKG